ncbi:hypothetical protein RCL_jg13379.t1 [Rhizophagus clarus]|uniref:Uncharacterized protein n=1 Tax=Rhizophagus clarus TaxID=94130 RepID=A0A8H3LKF9_9GLOM|nr:hypothetical protein RCL_jg13379.t1 [Rhizophagus clarus]
MLKNSPGLSILKVWKPKYSSRLFFEGLKAKVRKPKYSSRLFFLITSFRKSGVLFEVDRVFQSLEFHFEVQNSMSRQIIKSRTSLEADYGQNLEADWYFKGLEFRGGLVFRRSRTLVRSRPRYFEGLELEVDQRWTPPRGRPDLRLSKGLLAEFKIIGFPDAYRTNFED